jgi:hypothetical protein
MTKFDWANAEAGPSHQNPTSPNILPAETKVQTIQQPSYGRTRTRPVSVGRFQPYDYVYGVPDPRANEHRNTEAGPSTFVPSLAPHVEPQTSQPRVWTCESAANVATNQTVTEEVEAPVSRFYRSRISRVID